MNNFKRIALAGVASFTLMAAPAYAGMLGGSADIGIGANAGNNAVGIHTGVDTDMNTDGNGKASVGTSSHTNASANASANADASGVVDDAKAEGDAMRKKADETADMAKGAASSTMGQLNSEADANLSAKGAASVN